MLMKLVLLKQYLRASNHPLSRMLYNFIIEEALDYNPDVFEEILGKGIQAEINDMEIKIGSAGFVGAISPVKNETSILYKN